MVFVALALRPWVLKKHLLTRIIADIGMLLACSTDVVGANLLPDLRVLDSLSAVGQS